MLLLSVGVGVGVGVYSLFLEGYQENNGSQILVFVRDLLLLWKKLKW